MGNVETKPARSMVPNKESGCFVDLCRERYQLNLMLSECEICGVLKHFLLSVAQYRHSWVFIISTSKLNDH